MRDYFSRLISNSKISNIKTIIVCVLFLNLISLSALFSSLHQNGAFSAQALFYKQVIWIIIGWIFLFLFSTINYRFYFDLAFILYIINIILLLIVDFAGRTALGAQRWLSLGGFNFQPSELSKIVIIFFLARCFSSQGKKTFIKDVLIPLLFVGINALLIFKQPDLGTALVTIFIFFLVGFSSKIKKRYFFIFIIIGLLTAPIVWKFLKPYQKKRVTVFMNPNVDPLGAGYSIIQSKIAIGSGKFSGRGFLAGTQNQFNFLPERHTDFIFTVVAEEWGFVGSIFLLCIYGLILMKIIHIALTFKDSFAQLVAMGICALFFIHIFVNMGMTLGILPVVGIPLLFISYGGTHLLISFILLGIFFNIVRSVQYD